MEASQGLAKATRFPYANRAHHPVGFDKWWAQGREAAEAGQPREQPFTFAYSYEADCWLDGYDNIRHEGGKR